MNQGTTEIKVRGRDNVKRAIDAMTGGAELVIHVGRHGREQSVRTFRRAPRSGRVYRARSAS